MLLQATANDQCKRIAEVESTAVSHRAEAASLFRQAESAKQELASLRQELAGSRDRHRALEANLQGHTIGIKAEADATVEALRMQLTAATDKLKRLATAHHTCLNNFTVYSCYMLFCQDRMGGTAGIGRQFDYLNL